MDRRAFLRIVGLAGLGLGGQAASGHPLPEGDDRTPVAETPAGDEPLGFLALPAAYETVTSPDGHTAFVATGDGVAVVDVVTPTRPRLLAQRTDLLSDTEAGPISRVQDLAVSGTRLLVVGPAHPAEGAHGAVVFDVADRQDPTQVASVQVEMTIHNCGFDGRYAYLTGGGRDGNPLLVVDMRTGRREKRPDKTFAACRTGRQAADARVGQEMRLARHGGLGVRRDHLRGQRRAGPRHADDESEVHPVMHLPSGGRLRASGGRGRVTAGSRLSSAIRLSSVTRTRPASFGHRRPFAPSLAWVRLGRHGLDHGRPFVEVFPPSCATARYHARSRSAPKASASPALTLA